MNLFELKSDKKHETQTGPDSKMIFIPIEEILDVTQGDIFFSEY